jgi:dTDP-D-glucose 4,6-dehydratase
MPDRIWDSKTWQADVSKITADLKWAPKHSFQQGFEKTVDWLKSQPQMLNFYRTQREEFLSQTNK